MGSRSLTQTTVVSKEYFCDACHEKLKGEEIAWSHVRGTSFINGTQVQNDIIFCKDCLEKIPEDILVGLKGDNKTPKERDAYFIFSMFDDMDEKLEEYDLEFDKFPNLKNGVWAFYSTQNDAEIYGVEPLDSLDELESSAYDHEYRQRGWPLYLTALLVDGVIRRFKHIRKIEVI